VLAISCSIRRRLNYYVCCYPGGDADGRNHLHRHWPRDCPSPVTFRYRNLDLFDVTMPLNVCLARCLNLMANGTTPNLVRL